jgi:hypothetical protein
MHWNDCEKRPFLLRFRPDIHARWRLMIEAVLAPGIDASTRTRWISGVSKNGNEIELTLDEGEGEITRETFKLPEGRGDVYLGDKPYSFKLNRYSEIHHECIQGGP